MSQLRVPEKTATPDQRTHARRTARAAPLHAPGRRSARRGRVGQAPHRHHEPRRLGRLPDGRRRGAGRRGRSSPPTSWSRKYFRKAGLHGTPGHETSVRQVVHRIAHTHPRARASSRAATSPTPEDADTFEAELAYMLVHQIGAFNSPVWFNCGLCHEYGIDGSGGNCALGPETDAIRRRPPTPTSARSSRPASSSRSTTT